MNKKLKLQKRLAALQEEEFNKKFSRFGFKLQKDFIYKFSIWLLAVNFLIFFNFFYL
jgi:hypothetical protein